MIRRVICRLRGHTRGKAVVIRGRLYVRKRCARCGASLSNGARS